MKVAQATRVPKAVDDIIISRCSMCHANEPVWAGIVSPPKGVVLETHDQITRQKAQIALHSVRTPAMPPNNITGMTREERQTLAAWIGGVTAR